MGIIITFLVAIGLMSYIELPGLMKKQKTKELVVFVVLTFIGLVLAVAHAILNIDMAKVTDVFIKIFGGK